MAEWCGHGWTGETCPQCAAPRAEEPPPGEPREAVERVNRASQALYPWLAFDPTTGKPTVEARKAALEYAQAHIEFGRASRPASAPAGTPSEAAYQAAYDAFCRATGEHDQDEGIAAALAAAYAVDGRASGAPAGSAPEPSAAAIEAFIEAASQVFVAAESAENVAVARDRMTRAGLRAAYSVDFRGAAPTASAAAAEPSPADVVERLRRIGIRATMWALDGSTFTHLSPQSFAEYLSHALRGAASQRQEGREPSP